MIRGAVIALSHGGGALPVLGDPNHKDIVRSLKSRVPKILRLGTSEAPRAIILVTAHWSEKTPVVSNWDKHQLYYDYGGFPPESYKLKYDAPGSSSVAKEVFDVLSAVGLKPKMDSKRGWDHGVFIPMLLINPAADIPIVQLSVLSSESPSSHFEMGRALARLRDSNIAIIGSGAASFHNLSLLFSGVTSDAKFKSRNTEWSKAVMNAVLEKDVDKREKLFKGWRAWPGGFEMHPRDAGEHFMPLIVCAGAGEDQAAETYTDEFAGVEMFSYYWT